MTRADFWSRRRAEVAAEEARTEAALRDDAAQADLRTLEEKSDDEICAELGLPDPDSLNLGDNVRAFMAAGVPERLRRRALRRLWRTNPVLANLDGLADHNGDYTDAARVLPDLKTTYQVGKGLLKHLEYIAEPRETPVAAAPEDAALPDEKDQENQDAAPASTTKVVVASEPVSDDTAPVETTPRPRRMTFTFSSETA